MMPGTAAGRSCSALPDRHDCNDMTYAIPSGRCGKAATEQSRSRTVADRYHLYHLLHPKVRRGHPRRRVASPLKWCPPGLPESLLRPAVCDHRKKAYRQQRHPDSTADGRTETNHAEQHIPMPGPAHHHWIMLVLMHVHPNRWFEQSAGTPWAGPDAPACERSQGKRVTRTVDKKPRVITAIGHGLARFAPNPGIRRQCRCDETQRPGFPDLQRQVQTGPLGFLPGTPSLRQGMVKCCMPTYGVAPLGGERADER